MSKASTASPKPLSEAAHLQAGSLHYSAVLDHLAGAGIAQLTGGLSPASMAAAFGDWAVHLALSPGRMLDLAAAMWRDVAEYGENATREAPDQQEQWICGRPRPDHRFTAQEWKHWPFDEIARGFQQVERWWDQAGSNIRGVSRRHEDVVRFTLRQLLDTVAPTNFVATNPLVQKRIAETAGQCLIDGWLNAFDDVRRYLSHERPKGAEAFRPGIEVAVTPGEVVFRNHLIELIQYHPTTKHVHPEPLLIVPAWIMKYYILDLSPGNSLVRWLVAQGFTVFMISWRNPDSSDRDIGFDDYRSLGTMAAIDAIVAITGASRLHALGYCLGGTLLAITAAAMARDHDDRLASLALLATETQFSEPGELGLFIDASQIDLLEDMMWAQGYLDSRQMGRTFQLLRSNDLIWSRLVHGYLMGEPEPMNDLMAWNADGTRLPFAMHSEYLRDLFLDDRLAKGHLLVEGRTVVLNDIRCPILAISTEWDHVAPWRSVFKIHLMTETEITFILASGGHNVGIVAEPDVPGHHYRILVHAADRPHLDPDDWLQCASLQEGSWWRELADWLSKHSSAATPPPAVGNADRGYPGLEPAPGHYVLMR